MSLMNRVKALHVEDMDVVVEPGVGWMELNEYLEPYGLFFPLDPGPGATIGGMCATRCSGSLAVVLANGDVVKTASRARKSAAGFVSRVELLDEVQVRAINIANGKSLPETPTLMFEFIGTEAYSHEQTLIVKNIASEHNGSDFVFAEDPETKKELWKMRKEALWACFAMEPNFEAMISDRSPANLRYGARLLTMATLQQSQSRQLPPTWIVGGTLSSKLDFGSFA
ncbi:hypothetical protein ACE6H2_023940 [Prunus campanulata]